MPKIIPVVGDYCNFIDKEGKRIGRIIAEEDSSFLIKYYYDGFSGYTVIKEHKDRCTYIKQPIGVKINYSDKDIKMYKLFS